MKGNKLPITIIICICAFLLPFFYMPHNVILYYLLIIPFFAYHIIKEIHNKGKGKEKDNEKIDRRWEKVRKKGFWKSVVIEGVRMHLFIILTAMIINYVIEGHNPIQRLELLMNTSTTAKIVISLIFIGSILFFGIILWHENEKRYYNL